MTTDPKYARQAKYMEKNKEKFYNVSLKLVVGKDDDLIKILQASSNKSDDIRTYMRAGMQKIRRKSGE